MIRFRTGRPSRISRATPPIATWLALAVFGLGATFACKGDEPAKKLVADKSGKVALTLQLNWVPEPEFGGFYTAQHTDAYEKAGLDVRITSGAAGVQTWRMVATGKVPLAIASAGEVLRANLKDANLVAVYSIYDKNPMALMVHEETGVSALGEIFTSGKVGKVAMEAELPFGLHLKQKYGFDKVKVLQHSHNLSLFLQEKTLAQQCFIFSEPVSAKRQGVPVRAFSIGDSGFNPYQAVVIVRRDFLAKNRDVIERFVQASRAGWQAYLDGPGPTNEYMRTQGATMDLESMNLAAELQAPYIVSQETRKHGLGYMSMERWQTLADQLRTLGGIDGTPNVHEMFTHIAD